MLVEQQLAMPLPGPLITKNQSFSMSLLHGRATAHNFPDFAQNFEICMQKKKLCILTYFTVYSSWSTHIMWHQLPDNNQYQLDINWFTIFFFQLGCLPVLLHKMPGKKYFPFFLFLWFFLTNWYPCTLQDRIWFSQQHQKVEKF